MVKKSLYEKRKQIKELTKEFEWDMNEKIEKLKVRYRRFLGLDCFSIVALTYDDNHIYNNTTLQEVGFNPMIHKLRIYLENAEGMITFKVKQMRVKQD